MCLFFPHDISKTDAAMITKLDTEMLHDSPGNPFILGSEGHRSRSQITKSLPAWVCTLVSAGFLFCFVHHDGVADRKQEGGRSG